MKLNNLKIIITCTAVLLAGCASSSKIITPSVDDAVLGLAQTLVQRALGSPCLAGDKRPVLAIGRIQNETMSIRGGSFEMMLSQITSMLIESGKVRVTSAHGAVSDRQSPRSDQLLAPSMVLQGKLVQRETLQEGNRKCEFTLSLSIVDIASGQSLWRGDSSVGVLLDARTSTW